MEKLEVNNVMKMLENKNEIQIKLQKKEKYEKRVILENHHQPFDNFISSIPFNFFPFNVVFLGVLYGSFL